MQGRAQWQEALCLDNSLVQPCPDQDWGSSCHMIGIGKSEQFCSYRAISYQLLTKKAWISPLVLVDELT